MNIAEVMRELESLGSEATRKTYRRHGVTGDQFGVKYGDLEKLVKRVKTNHELAKQLWGTGNHDARALAAKIADPAALDSRTADRWMKDCDNYVLTVAIAPVIARSPVARDKFEAWRGSKSEWTERTAWLILAHLAGDRARPDSEFEPWIAEIEQRIHGAKNRVRDAMNGALIAIATRSEALLGPGRAAAERIGPVEVDHGDTACVTVAAGEYIDRILAHRAAKAAGPGKRRG